MENINLQPLSIEEMKETNGGSILGLIVGIVVGLIVGAIIYGIVTSDGVCDCECEG